MSINLTESYWPTIFSDPNQAADAVAWQRYLLTELDKLPRGEEEKVKIEANVTGLTADGDIAGLSITRLLEVGREYEISAIVHVLSTSSGGLFRTNLMRNGTRIQIWGANAGSAGANGVVTTRPTVTISGDGNEYDVTAYLDVTTAGTYTIVAGDEFPCQLTITDVGQTPE